MLITFIKQTTQIQKDKLLVILVMNIFLHSIDPLKVVNHILRDKSECTIQLPCFQNCLSSSNFQNTVSNSARMHHHSCFHYYLSISNFQSFVQTVSEWINQLPCFQNVLSSSKTSFQIVRMHHFPLNVFLAFQTSINIFQIGSDYASFSVLAFKKQSQQLQLPKRISTSVRMHLFASLHFKKNSQHFKIPKHCFKQRQNASFCLLAFHIFSAVPTSKIQFQIAPECIFLRPCF